mmetsp:Transcript_52799/g.150524  ORF Transcript_52799/g.150524 Transcript_52799/m.150524 type:complete len:282 (+) Transcript_52799:168-1013(+)
MVQAIEHSLCSSFALEEAAEERDALLPLQIPSKALRRGAGLVEVAGTPRRHRPLAVSGTLQDCQHPAGLRLVGSRVPLTAVGEVAPDWDGLEKERVCAVLVPEGDQCGNGTEARPLAAQRGQQRRLRVAPEARRKRPHGDSMLRRRLACEERRSSAHRVAGENHAIHAKARKGRGGVCGMRRQKLCEAHHVIGHELQIHRVVVGMADENGNRCSALRRRIQGQEAVAEIIVVFCVEAPTMPKNHQAAAFGVHVVIALARRDRGADECTDVAAAANIPHGVV